MLALLMAPFAKQDEGTLPLRLCMVVPFGSTSYAQRHAIALLAGEHVNTRNYTYVSNSTSMPLLDNRLKISVNIHSQGNVDAAFAAVAKQMHQRR
jgi:hypothetical protein